jgi:hypothetical protein
LQPQPAWARHEDWRLVKSRGRHDSVTMQALWWVWLLWLQLSRCRVMMQIYVWPWLCSATASHCRAVLLQQVLCRKLDSSRTQCWTFGMPAVDCQFQCRALHLRLYWHRILDSMSDRHPLAANRLTCHSNASAISGRWPVACPKLTAAPASTRDAPSVHAVSPSNRPVVDAGLAREHAPTPMSWPHCTLRQCKHRLPPGRLCKQRELLLAGWMMPSGTKICFGQVPTLPRVRHSRLRGLHCLARGYSLAVPSQRALLPSAPFLRKVARNGCPATTRLQLLSCWFLLCG